MSTVSATIEQVEQAVEILYEQAGIPLSNQMSVEDLNNVLHGLNDLHEAKKEEKL